MDEYQADMPRRVPLGVRVRRVFRFLWALIEHLFDALVDALGVYARIMRREAALFFGVGLALVGFLNFQNGKNCDGNTSDYLSCTRPSTFYYYSWVEITIIVIGVFLLMLWFFRLHERPRRVREEMSEQ